MTDSMLVATLGFATREFDRLYESLVAQDEPGPQEVHDADDDAADDRDATSPVGEEHNSSNALLRGAASAAAGVARAGAGMARAGAKLVTGSIHPRASEWHHADVDQRISWWTSRLSTAVAALAALPSASGRLGHALGIVDAVGAAGQIVMVNAVGRELGASPADRIRVAGDLVLGTQLAPDEIERAVGSAPVDATPDSDLAQADREDAGVVGRLGRTAQLIHEVARRLLGVRSALGERQRGGFFARAASNLPVVGAAGGFLAERSGVNQAADAARRAFATD